MNEATGHYEIGPIDWDEFYRVIKGDGPCNKERLQARVDAWEDGAWVREAAAAYAHEAGRSYERALAALGDLRPQRKRPLAQARRQFARAPTKRWPCKMRAISTRVVTKA